MIKINRIEPFTCEAFSPDGKSLGFLNEYEYNDLRIQIKEAEATGYYMLYNGAIIRIDQQGNMEHNPKGFYDTIINQLFELI